MSVKVHIHQSHRQYTNGTEVVETKGFTVGECLKDLVRQYPALAGSLYGKKGGLNPLLEIYVNGASAYPDEMAKRVKDGDAIHITLLLSGG